MINVITPPTQVDWSKTGRSVFLAGSIENGAAWDWQAEIVEYLHEQVTDDLTVLNPRRPDWDPDTKDITPQIEWELDALERADLIVMYFSAQTTSPISLLELGLFAKSGRLVVCCPTGYFRRTNVETVCRRYGVRQVDDLHALTRSVVEWSNAAPATVNPIGPRVRELDREVVRHYEWVHRKQPGDLVVPREGRFAGYCCKVVRRMPWEDRKVAPSVEVGPDDYHTDMVSATSLRPAPYTALLGDKVR